MTAFKRKSKALSKVNWCRNSFIYLFIHLYLFKNYDFKNQKAKCNKNGAGRKHRLTVNIDIRQ